MLSHDLCFCSVGFGTGRPQHQTGNYISFEGGGPTRGHPGALQLPLQYEREVD